MSTWVFLRGLTREARHWGSFPDVFCATVPQAQVMTPDLPGAGRWNSMDSPARIDAIADLLRADLHSRDVAPPYWLLGLSLGGMVAIDWASRHPQEVAGCVLINTSMRPLGGLFERLRPRQYLPLLRAGLASRPETRERLVLAASSRLARDEPALIRAWSTWYREHPVSRRNALRQLVAAACYRAPSRRPASPILLLASAHDEMVDAACSARLAAHWRLPLEIHPAAGHDLPLDDPEWVAARVRAWRKAAAPVES